MRRSRPLAPVVLAALCCAGCSEHDSEPTPDLGGGGAIKQRGREVAHVERYASCPTEGDACLRRSYPVTELPAAPSPAHPLVIAVPRSSHVDAIAIRDGGQVGRRGVSSQLIDYGAIEAILFPDRGRPTAANLRRAGGVRVVAYGQGGSRGFELRWR